MNTGIRQQPPRATREYTRSLLGTIGLSQQQDDRAPSAPDQSTTDGTTAETPRTGPEVGSPGDDGDKGDDDGEETTPETSADEESDLPLDQVFEILKNSRRREALHYLSENGGEASLSDLAEHIAALENDTTVDAISSSQRKRVYVGLYQCHLPKMDDMGVVDFNQNRGTIERAKKADELEPYLTEDVQPPWHQIYGGVVAVGVVLFGASLTVGGVVGLTPSIVLAALLVAMGMCSLGHVTYRRREADA